VTGGGKGGSGHLPVDGNAVKKVNRGVQRRAVRINKEGKYRGGGRRKELDRQKGDLLIKQNALVTTKQRTAKKNEGSELIDQEGFFVTGGKTLP